MIEPKIFYRELDSILAKIAEEKSGDTYFESILKALEAQFGRALNIKHSFVYEQRGDEFILIYSSAKDSTIRITSTLPTDTDVVQKVMKHKSFIYSDPVLMEDFELKNETDFAVTAAISVYSPEKNWLLVFELTEGWQREEISLFLNAVRTAINYRLFSRTIWTELERSVQIQKSLLPKESPKIEGYDIFGYSQPAELVGGDFYEYFQFEGDYILGTAIGDASGHGLPAARRRGAADHAACLPLAALHLRD